MARLIHLEFADGTKQSYPLTGADIVKMERQYGRSESAEAGMFLAWCAATRLKKTTLEFEAWLEQVSEMSDQPIPLAPTNGGASGLPPLPDSTPSA